MALKRPTPPKQGKCGEAKFFPDLTIPLTGKELADPKNSEKFRINPVYTDEMVTMLFGAVYEAQARLCALEGSNADVGTLTYTPEVNTYGTLTIKNLEIANASAIVQLHLFVIYVNEVKPVYATVSGGVGDTAADVTVTVSQSNDDASDSELTFKQGDYVLWADNTVASTGRGGHRFEISRIKKHVSAGSWILQRRPNNIDAARGYFGSYIDTHASGIKLYKVQVKHFPWKIKQGPWFGDFESDYERRGDFLWPSRCVLATQIVAELGAGGTSQIFEVPLQPTVDTTTDGDATTSPVSPGLRTLAGQSYILPTLLGEDDLTETTDVGKIIRVQDLASLRTIYCDVQTAPQGGTVVVTVKYKVIGGSWQDIETITIPVGQSDSFSGSSTNNPANRRMPYTLDWPPVVLPQDAHLGYDIDTIGATIPGAGLVVYIQT